MTKRNEGGHSTVQLPNYIKIKNKGILVIRAGSEWEGYKDHEITIANVVSYYRGDARDISSGCRSLGTIVGDWRNIDCLAEECLEAFRAINPKELKKEGVRHGMTLKE